MAQTDAVSLIVSGSNEIDIEVDGTSVNVAGVSYPFQLPGNQTITAGTFTFNRLGQTTASALTLSLGDQSVVINVEGTGYVY